MKGAGRACRPPRNTEIRDLYVRPLQVSRYLRQFPSPCSPNRSLLRQADLNSLQESLRAGRWQVSRYLRQFPSPRSPSLSLFSQARRNSSHCPPPPRSRPSSIRTPPGPIWMDWEKAVTGTTRRVAAATMANATMRIPLIMTDPPNGQQTSRSLLPCTARSASPLRFGHHDCRSRRSACGQYSSHDSIIRIPVSSSVPVKKTSTALRLKRAMRLPWPEQSHRA